MTNQLRDFMEGGEEIMDRVNQLQAFNKAIAAGIVGLVGLIVTALGYGFSPEIQTALLTIVTAVIVWAVPNR